MIDFIQLTAPERILCRHALTSKKKALQTVAELLGSGLADETVSEMDFLDALIGREKLGSTGLGHGVALPHGRISGLSEPLGALVTVDGGVEFDAPDGTPVDLLFGLVVPEKCSEKHLQILASLAKAFSSESFRDELREQNDAAGVMSLLEAYDAAQSTA